MGCMAPQLYATVGNRLCLGVLGYNRWPTVPEVIYPDSSPRPFVEQVAKAGHLTVGRTGSHMVLWTLS
jgi:hypothetical protein